MSLSVGIDFIASILASVFKELRNINDNKNRSNCCIVNINNYYYQLQGHKVSPKQEIQTLNHLYIPHDINVSSLQSFLIIFVLMHWRACSLIPSALSLNINTTFLPRGISKYFWFWILSPSIYSDIEVEVNEGSSVLCSPIKWVHLKVKSNLSTTWSETLVDSFMYQLFILWRKKCVSVAKTSSSLTLCITVFYSVHQTWIRAHSVYFSVVVYSMI